MAAVVAKMIEPTTSAGTTSNTLCGRWQVIVAMPAQARQVWCSVNVLLPSPCKKSYARHGQSAVVPFTTLNMPEDPAALCSVSPDEEEHTAAVGQEVGCGPCAVAEVAWVWVLGNGALHNKHSMVSDSFQPSLGFIIHYSTLNTQKPWETV